MTPSAKRGSPEWRAKISAGMRRYMSDPQVRRACGARSRHAWHRGPALLAKRNRWQRKELAYLKRHYADTISKNIAAALGRSLPQVYQKAAERGLKKAPGFASRLTKEKMATGWRASGTAWTPAQLAQLRALFPHRRTADIAAQCGHSRTSCDNKAHQLGIRKTVAYLASPAACRLRRGDNVGAAHRFPKGHVPANKGLRRPGYSIGRGRMQETQFKKGQMPVNHVPVGTVTWSPGRIKNGVIANNYQKIKIAEPNVWRWLHRKTWEDAYGPIPSGYGVGFIDGDRANVSLTNLVLLSRAERARANNIWNSLPRELAEVIQLRGALRRAINRRKQGHVDDQRAAHAPV